jgi:hypothetical protein
MKVLVLMTWENPKSYEGRKAWREVDMQYYLERIEKHNVKTSEWTDGTGKMYYMMEFENYDAYGKFMDDEELHRDFAHRCRLINNVKLNVLREAL